MNRISRILIFSIFFIILFDLPILYIEDDLPSNFYQKLVLHLLILIPATTLVFYLLSHIRYFGSVILAVFCVLGALSDYFICSFKKSFDAGVLADMLSVEISLIMEYMNWYILSISLVATCLMIYLFSRFLVNIKFDGWKTFTLAILIPISILVLIFAATSNYQLIKCVVFQYHPFSIFRHAIQYRKNYRLHYQLCREKVDLTKLYHFEFVPNNTTSSSRNKSSNINDLATTLASAREVLKTKLIASDGQSVLDKDESTSTASIQTLRAETELPSKSDDDLIVVFIIGESMRGDLISKDNMPHLFSRDNIVIFKQAQSSATSTRVSLPYMLTSAVPNNAEQSLSEKSIISIFGSLGFGTNWIGNQRLFGIYDTTYASIALEADYTISRKELEIMVGLKSASKHEKICDECLLPLFSQRLNHDIGNKFFVLHFMGSHWDFAARLPNNYKRKFLPYCTSSIVKNCSTTELVNSYLDTISYSDEVLDKILSHLEDKNAIVFYASDHGFSLFENGYFGNAYVGPNVPKAQLDIAMFIWGSKRFIQDNPDKWNAIQRKQNSPVSHDNLFHSILSCVGVKSDYIDQSLDLCHP